MVESTGTRLRKARLARGLSLEDVAQATKIRPDNLAALEADEFSHFPSMAYCRGFLTLYGRHMGVDVSDQAQSMEGHNALHQQQYQYLDNSSAPPLPEDHLAPRERSASVMPLLFFFGLAVLAGLGLWVFITARRLGLG